VEVEPPEVIVSPTQPFDPRPLMSTDPPDIVFEILAELYKRASHGGPAVDWGHVRTLLTESGNGIFFDEVKAAYIRETRDITDPDAESTSRAAAASSCTSAAAAAPLSSAAAPASSCTSAAAAPVSPAATPSAAGTASSTGADRDPADAPASSPAAAAAPASSSAATADVTAAADPAVSSDDQANIPWAMVERTPAVELGRGQKPCHFCHFERSARDIRKNGCHFACHSCHF
jgi:hypothetical protein